MTPKDSPETKKVKDAAKRASERLHDALYRLLHVANRLDDDEPDKKPLPNGKHDKCSSP